MKGRGRVLAKEEAAAHVAPAAFISTSLRHWHFSKCLTASALMQWTAGNLPILDVGDLLGANRRSAIKTRIAHHGRRQHHFQPTALTQNAS